MNKLWHPVLIVLCLIFPWTALAHMEHMDSHHGAGTTRALAASAAFGPDGRLWVVSADDGHLSLRHSDDRGRTLSPPDKIIPEAGSILTMGEDKPKIAVGPQGEIYVSWTQSLPKPYTGRIFFARSLDGGRHFSALLRVHRDRDEITHRLEALAVDRRGRVLVAWIDRRDFEAAQSRGDAYSGTAVYYAWSDDQGAHFTPEQKLADHSCECCRIAVSQAPDGGIGVFWRANDAGGLRDHGYALLRNGAVAQGPARVTFSGWRVDACPHQGPGLALAADGTRHAVWFTAKDGEPVIWYGQLNPEQPPRHVLAVARLGAAHADIAAAGERVWIVWNQVGAEGMMLMSRLSTDAGAHFHAPREIARTPTAAGAPQLLLSSDEQAYVAWDTGDGFRFIPITETEQP